MGPSTMICAVRGTPTVIHAVHVSVRQVLISVRSVLSCACVIAHDAVKAGVSIEQEPMNSSPIPLRCFR